MKINQSLFIVLFSVVLISGCDFNPKSGGPCKYALIQERAEVVSVNETRAVLKNDFTEVDVELKFFKTSPRLRDWYKIKFQKITQGACTPIQIKSVEFDQNQLS